VTGQQIVRIEMQQVTQDSERRWGRTRGKKEKAKVWEMRSMEPGRSHELDQRYALFALAVHVSGISLRCRQTATTGRMGTRNGKCM
jgi:hypothetical protein